MNVRKHLAPALLTVLVGAIGGGIWYSNGQLGEEHAQRQLASQAQARHVTLRGLIGSEKEAFFNDPRVRHALEAQGIGVTVEKAGSRTIVAQFDAARYDFGLPSGAPDAERLRQVSKAKRVFNPFYTPMVIASWRPIADILVANGIVERQGELYYLTDLPRLLDLIQHGTRWRELKDSGRFSTSKSVLINSTDIRSSNSAAMYLALASYFGNGQQVVQSQADVERVLPVVAPLFLRQGFQEQSSSAPFEDYLALGMGKTPLLFAYESQLVEFWLRHPDRRKGDMVMIYPRPTVYSKHVLVPYTPAGERLGVVLESDPALRALAHEYGFRTGGDVHGPEEWARQGITVPDTLDDVIDPPSQEWQERLIQAIETRFK